MSDVCLDCRRGAHPCERRRPLTDSIEPFCRSRPPRKGPPRDWLEFPVVTKRVTVKYRVLPYSSRPDQGQARADALAPRTGGSQAVAHDPRAARPGTAPDLQEETNR